MAEEGMKEYHKIHSMFKRGADGRIIEGDWAMEEFEYLAGNKWIFTEKVDGTNIRVGVGGDVVEFGGRTERAQIPAHLVSALMAQFTPLTEACKSMFPNGAVLYGEGYGSGIQKGGKYRQDVGFVMFDISVGQWRLKRVDVEMIGASLGIDVVPVVGEGTLYEGIEMVKRGLKSTWGDFEAEGIVAVTTVPLRARSGTRIITKIKARDFTPASKMKEYHNEVSK